MCLAIPGLVISKEAAVSNSIPATVRFGSALHDVDLMLVPEAAVGDYVIVHSGFAIRTITAAEAEDLLAALEMPGQVKRRRVAAAGSTGDRT